MMMAFMNPSKAGGWAWVGVVGGILLFVSVFLPWLDLWGLAMPTGFQLGMLALASGNGLIIFFVGNIIFIWLFGIAGLALLLASRFRTAMAFGILALAFCTFDLVIYLLIGFGPLLSIGPFTTMAGAVMLVEGCHRLSKGSSPRTNQMIIGETATGYNSLAPGGSQAKPYPDYSSQNLYGSGQSTAQPAKDPNALYGQQDTGSPPKGP